MSDLLIDVGQLRDRLGSPGLLIFDVRHDLADHAAGRLAYEQGHIPGACYLDHETQLAAERTGKNGRHPLPTRDELAALMRMHGLTPKTQVVIYDAGNGMFAAHLWWMLRWLGHERAAVLDGGWAAWREADAPVQADVRRPGVTEAQALQAAALPAKPAMPTVDADAVLANLSAPAFTVLDARAPERYRGETEPMDPVAGHIPGALNRPNGLNVQADGRFKSGETLRREFEELLRGVPPEQVVHQCGSGITACHNLFAMELAGLSGSVLYPGSWSEWCSDTSRPVALGA